MKYAMLGWMLGLAVAASAGTEPRAGGTSLISPPGSTPDENLRRVHECDVYAHADRNSGRTLTDWERAALEGRATLVLTRGGRLAVNRDNNPVLSARRPHAAATRAADDLADRYTLCVMARGFAWPERLAAPGPAAVSREARS